MKATLITMLVSTAAANGSIAIWNNCNRGIGYQIDGQGTAGTPHWIAAGSSNVVQLSGAPGQAIKFSPNGDFTQPISFDYTLNTQDGKVYYDVSDVAGHPIDVFVTPGPMQCPLVACPATWEKSVCDLPMTCDPEANYTVELCARGDATEDDERWVLDSKKAARRFLA